MTERHPPVLAIRLMEDAGTDPAAIGDIVETYSQGRHAGWFWRQAIKASLPPPIDALRWGVAIPVAWFASGIWPVWASPFARIPLMAATFVLCGALMVPSRKLFVAKTLLALVCAWAAVPIAISLTSPRFSTWPAGVLALSGGLAGYGAARIFIQQNKRTSRLTQH